MLDQKDQQLNHSVMQKDQVILEKDEQLVQKDCLVEHKDNELKQKDDQLKQKDNELKRRDQEILMMKRSYHEKGQQLQGDKILQCEGQEGTQSEQKDQQFELRHLDDEVKQFFLCQYLLHTLFSYSGNVELHLCQNWV